MGSLRIAEQTLPTSLRRKTLLIIALTTIGMVGGLFFISRYLLNRGFGNLEEEFARENVARASSAIANELTTLDRTTSEYAAWDQTYAFVHGDKPKFIQTEFPATTFQQLQISFVLIYDADGKRLFAKGFDLRRGGEARLPEGLEEHLKPDSPLLTHRNLTSREAGILALKSGPILVDARPILTSDNKGPIAGTMVMGRVLDAPEFSRLGVVTHTPMKAEQLNGDLLDPDFQSAASQISHAEPVAVTPLSDDSLAGYEELKDIYGRPALIIRVSLPRPIHAQGKTSLLQFLLLLLASAFVFGAVILRLLERVVISRIANLSDSITQIGASGDLSARLVVTGKDELAYLGTAINGMLEDLERSQLERHEGRTRLSVMIERMPAVLWTTDKELRFTSSMGAGLDALGLKPGEIAGVRLFDYFQTDDPNSPPIQAHGKALLGESVTYEMEWNKRIFECHVQPLRSNEGETLGVIGVALDITDRKHLADQLRQSQKMQAVGELAGGVAHDFNNLLMVMKGHAEMLLERLTPASAELQNAEQIHQAAERAAGLTRQLLAFSRKQVLQPRVLDMNEVVAGMIQMVSRIIGESIELAFLPGPKLGCVKADPSQVEQVVLNLVVNARDAMPDGGRLTIETSNIDLDRNYATSHAVVEPGPYVMLTVTDTGCGMDAETQARIFEPFFTTKGPGRGTGLGLATVYGVVKQSGGYIWVYSELQHGTTFKVYLPRVAATAEKLVAEKQPVAPSPGTETILFVEDEENVRELVSEYLKARGYTVLEAGDGVAALALAEQHDGAIQLLITDVVMPKLSGRELATRVAAKRENLKVLYISGYTDDSIFRHGVLEGGMAFLQKPFNLKALAEKVREVLDGVPAAVLSDRG
ncbi:MAG: CHASE4 domain-containing protein [Candidatus Acidiferrales bacterium]